MEEESPLTSITTASTATIIQKNLNNYNKKYIQNYRQTTKIFHFCERENINNNNDKSIFARQLDARTSL